VFLDEVRDNLGRVLGDGRKGVEAEMESEERGRALRRLEMVLRHVKVK